MARTPDDRLRRLASHYEAEVGHARADRLAASVLLRVRPQFATRRRAWQVAVASATVALMGFAGLGALADQAIPGQVLYPVDRAYESVAGFIGGSEDRSEERLVEALELIDRGRQTEAVDLIDEAIDQLARRPELQIAPVDTGDSTPSTIVTNPTPSSTPAQAPATTAPIDETVASPPVVIAAADAATSLRLATEFLLRTVRDAKDQAGDANLTEDVSRAASELLAAAEVVKETPVTIPVVAAPETTTTVVESTTSTSEPAPESQSSTTSTTTTVPGSTTTTTTTATSSTTTTTQPGGGDGGPGPIIIPPQP